jgi:hypothetical protein
LDLTWRESREEGEITGSNQPIDSFVTFEKYFGPTGPPVDLPFQLKASTGQRLVWLHSTMRCSSWYQWFRDIVYTVPIVNNVIFLMYGHYERDIKRWPVYFDKTHPFYKEKFQSKYQVLISDNTQKLLTKMDSMNCTSETFYASGMELLKNEEISVIDKHNNVLYKLECLLRLRHYSKESGARVPIKAQTPN